MKKIAVIGPHCVNRAEMCKALSIWFSTRGAKIKEISATPRWYLCLPEQKHGYVECETAVMRAIVEERHAEQKGADVIISDGCVYDPIIYYTVNRTDTELIQKTLFEDLLNYLLAYMTTYDALLYIKPGPDPIILSKESPWLPEDSMPEQKKKEYQMLIDEIYQEQLFAMNSKIVNGMNLVSLPIEWMEQAEVLSTPNVVCERVQKCL